MGKKILKLRNKGFTLIELMFGISILLIAIIASLSAFINCMFLNESSRNLTTAVHDAEYVLEQIRAQEGPNDISSYISSYPSAQFPQIKSLPNENITFFPNPVYTPTSFTQTLDTITVQISWDERNVQKTFSITTCFAKT